MHDEPLLGPEFHVPLRVPRDLSVVGFDDLPEAENSDPPLTTVANPRVLLGRTAVEMLLQAAAGRFAEPQARALEGCLIVRESTGPPHPGERGLDSDPITSMHLP